MANFSSTVDTAIRDLDRKMFKEIRGDKPHEYWVNKFKDVDLTKAPLTSMALDAMKETHDPKIHTIEGWNKYQRQISATKALETKKNKGLL